MGSETPVVVAARGVSRRFRMVAPGQELKTMLLHPRSAFAGRRHHDVARLVPAPVERPQVGHA